MKKVAIVCANGIGDALMSMVLTHNAELAGFRVDTYSTILLELKEWFPGKNIYPFPPRETLESIFASYDLVIGADHSLISNGDLSPKIKTIILKENSFDKSKTIVDNLLSFAKNQFNLESPLRTNGITSPQDLVYQLYSKRIILHTESTEAKRKWPAKKFIALARMLDKKGWRAAICLNPQERVSWQKYIPEYPFIDFPTTLSLADAAAYIYQSRALIGNNSGLGHLASCMGLPTVSLFARKTYANLWRPGFGKNRVVTPLPLLIGAGLKYKYWQKFLFPSKVLSAFEKIEKE